MERKIWIGLSLGSNCAAKRFAVKKDAVGVVGMIVGMIVGMTVGMLG